MAGSYLERRHPGDEELTSGLSAHTLQYGVLAELQLLQGRKLAQFADTFPLQQTTKQLNISLNKEKSQFLP